MREHIVINSDRSVTVPDSLKKIGIQYDHNVNTLTFDCPRYADDAQSIDMSKMQIFINWMLPDKSIGSSIAENIIIDEADSTLMHFDWIITSAVTPVFGILERTLVCIKQTDTDGREIYHWNTDLFQKFSVGEGMECNEQLAEENMDVITQLLVKMDAVDTRTSTEAMRSYVSEYMTENPPQPSDEQANAGVDAYMTENGQDYVNTYMGENVQSAVNTYMDVNAQSKVNTYMEENAQEHIDTYMEQNAQNKVDDYLERNPLQLDNTLTDPTKAAPADKVGEIGTEVDELKGDISNLISVDYGTNLFNRDAALVGFWYVHKNGKAEAEENEYTGSYGAVIINVENKESITLSTDNASMRIYNYLLVDDNMDVLGGSMPGTATFPYTINNTVNAKNVCISLRYYDELKVNQYVMCNAGDTALPYEAYHEPVNTLNTEYEPLKTMLAKTDSARYTMHINASDDDVALAEKMVIAFIAGNTDVYFEKSIYTLSDAYEYLHATGLPDCNGLPVGNNCRYYFNGSTIISIIPTNGWSEYRNILDSTATVGNFEVYDCVLINNGGHYCIHDESNGSGKKYFHKYSNVTSIYKDVSTGVASACFGCGIGLNTDLVFDCCSFITDSPSRNSFFFHGVIANPNNKAHSLRLSMRDCYISTENITIASPQLLDKDRDTLDFYLFGNKFETKFNSDLVNLIENNNTTIK